MRGYIIGLVVVIMVGLGGLVLWQFVFKTEPTETSQPEEIGFKPVQELIAEYSAVTQTTAELTPVSPESSTFVESEPSLIATPIVSETGPGLNNPPGVSGSAPEGVEYYEVQKRDTLWDISKKFYGTGTKYKVIYDANRNKLTSLDVYLKPGMKLAIPRKGLQSQSSKEYFVEGINPQGGNYYTIKKGDSLEKIALKFYQDRSKYQIIFKANRDKLTTPETTLRIGWKLFIPSLDKPNQPVSSAPSFETENIPAGVPE